MGIFSFRDSSLGGHYRKGPHKRVFKKGRKIRTMAAFDKWVSSGGWIFWVYQSRAVHPGWAMSWQYQMVKNSLGRIWKAVRIDA